MLDPVIAALGEKFKSHGFEHHAWREHYLIMSRIPFDPPRESGYITGGEKICISKDTSKPIRVWSQHFSSLPEGFRHSGGEYDGASAGQYAPNDAAGDLFEHALRVGSIDAAIKDLADRMPKR